MARHFEDIRDFERRLGRITSTLTNLLLADIHLPPRTFQIGIPGQSVPEKLLYAEERLK